MVRTNQSADASTTRLAGIRNFFLEQKYRFDLGTQFLSYVNLALLIIAASDKLKLIVPWRISEFLLVLIPVAFIMAWCLGYFLDTFVKYPQASMRLVESRSPNTALIHEKLDRMEKEISLLRKESSGSKRRSGKK